jgi:hypothetical protein
MSHAPPEWRGRFLLVVPLAFLIKKLKKQNENTKTSHITQVIIQKNLYKSIKIP